MKHHYFKGFLLKVCLLRNTENIAINCSNLYTSPFAFWTRLIFITVILDSFKIMYPSGFSQVSVKESTSSLWSVIISFTKSAFVERDLIFNKPSFIICFSVLFTFFICLTSIKLLLIDWFGRFLVWGTDTVSIVWYLGERVSMCWEFTDFCDVRRLADGRFSQSVCFLTWAPVSQVWTLRLCALFLDRRAAPPQEEWRPSTVQ